MLPSIISLIGLTVMYATPLVFGALGGVVSERSGVVYIGIEGMMSIGAIMGVVFSHYTGNPWIGFLAGGIGGLLVALLHAIASVTFKADQTISGVAINMLAPGVALFICRRVFNGAAQSTPVEKLPRILDPNLFDNVTQTLNLNVSTVVAFVMVVVIWFIMYRTKWGLRVRAVGEHPAAADTLGINVSRTRYLCVLASGFLAGLGGAAVTLNIVSSFNQISIAGQGFIALAAVIFGKWTPQGALGACLLFGFTQGIAVQIQGAGVAVPTPLIMMIPYVLTLVVLVAFVGRSVAPKADGVPYEKGSR